MREKTRFGHSIHELCTAFLVTGKVDHPSIYRKLTKAILGIPLNKKIEEFEKGDVHIRMVCTRQPQYPNWPIQLLQKQLIIKR